VAAVPSLGVSIMAGRMLRPTSLRDQQREMICSMLRPQADKVCCPSSVHTLKRLEWEKCVLPRVLCLRSSCDRDIECGQMGRGRAGHAAPRCPCAGQRRCRARLDCYAPCRASAGLWGGECWCFFLVDVCCWLQRRNLVHESVSRFTDVWVCVCAAVWTHRASIAQ
jgi:hypothetical protein